MKIALRHPVGNSSPFYIDLDLVDTIFNGPIFQLLVHPLPKRAKQQSWLFGLFSHPFKDCCLASSGYYCTLLTFKSVTRILFVRVFYLPPPLQTCVATRQASLQLRAQSLGSDLMLPRKPKRGRPRIQIIGLDSDGIGEVQLTKETQYPCETKLSLCLWLRQELFVIMKEWTNKVQTIHLCAHKGGARDRKMGKS